MPSASSDNSLKTWALGIIGTVLAAVLIFVIEQKLTVQPPQPKQPTIVSVNGQVFDGGAKRLLENAVVRLHVSSFNGEQSTDSEGRYAFSLEDFDPRLSGTLQVEAAGYQALTYNLTLQQMSTMQDLNLVAVGPAPPTGVTIPGVVTSHPALASHYVPRIDVKRISALAHH
jgi:hypothetical protein